MSRASSTQPHQHELTNIQHDILQAIQVCNSKGFPATPDLIQVRTGYAMEAIQGAVDSLVQKKLVQLGR